jgi:hypothetical protein
LEVRAVALDVKDDVFKNALESLDVLYELLLQRQHPNDAWIWGQLQPLNIIVRILERTLKDGAGAISSTTGMFIYHLDNKVFKKALRMLNTVLSVQSIHPCIRIRSCKLAAVVGAVNVLQRALQFAPKVFHSLALTALSSILSVAPVASRFHDLGGSFLVMADEIQRVMDAGHKVDEIVKFDRILRLLPLCGALARHPQHLELIVAGGKCSLASTLLKLVVYAMPPAICRRLSDSYAELKGCSTLQEEIHAFADALPDAFTILRRISVAQRACEILGDLAAACAVLPRDASFYLMQSLEHVFSIELPANHSHLKPSSAHSTASSRFTSITCNATVGGFCLMVLRVLCPLLSSAAASPPHISLKLLLAVVSTAEFASLSVNAHEPDLAPAVGPVLAAAGQVSPNAWSCIAVKTAWQRRSAIIDCLFARRPDLCKPPFNRNAIASLEEVPEEHPAERGSPAQQDNAADDGAHEQKFVQELQSPSDGGGARVETSSM